MYRIIKALEQESGVNFFELVINPDDYGQTVENVFYASFLIKDGQVAIHVDDDGLIRISETRLPL